MQDSQSLIDNLGLSYFKMDPQGVLVEASASLCAALGYTCEQVIGRGLNEFIPPVELNEMMAESIGKAYVEKDLYLGQIGRGNIFSRARLARLEDEGGELKGYYGLLQDLTGDRGFYHGAMEISDQERSIAKRIQDSFLPRELPKYSGWELAAYFEAAQDVAGDFYDIFPLAEGRSIGVVVADVCDKGVSAALFMVLIRSLVHAFADQHYALGWMDILDDINQAGDEKLQLQGRRKMLSVGATALKKAVGLTHKYVLENHGHTNMFATLFFGVIDPDSGVVSYINAGHEPPVLLGGGQIICRLDPTGVAIGLPIDASFQIQQVVLAPGDMLFAYTDGVTDARDSQEKIFTEKKMLALLQSGADTAEAMIEKVAMALEEHTRFIAPYDDITMLAVRRSTA